MQFHAQSTFSAGPRRPFTRDERRIWLAMVEMHRRAQSLTALHALIASCLLRRLGVEGRCDPSHDTLAADAGCCPRTVREALRRLRRLGLLSWLRRLVRVGGAVRQTSNAYELCLSGSPARSAAATIRRRREPCPPHSVAQQIAAALAWAGEKSASVTNISLARIGSEGLR